MSKGQSLRPILKRIEEGADPRLDLLGQWD